MSDDPSKNEGQGEGCGVVRNDELVNLVLNDLDPARAAEIRAHTTECRDCLRKLTALQTAVGSFAVDDSDMAGEPLASEPVMTLNETFWKETALPAEAEREARRITDQIHELCSDVVDDHLMTLKRLMFRLNDILFENIAEEDDYTFALGVYMGHVLTCLDIAENVYGGEEKKKMQAIVAEVSPETFDELLASVGVESVGELMEHGRDMMSVVNEFIADVPEGEWEKLAEISHDNPTELARAVARIVMAHGDRHFDMRHLVYDDADETAEMLGRYRIRLDTLVSTIILLMQDTYVSTAQIEVFKSESHRLEADANRYFFEIDEFRQDEDGE